MCIHVCVRKQVLLMCNQTRNCKALWHVLHVSLIYDRFISSHYDTYWNWSMIIDILHDWACTNQIWKVILQSIEIIRRYKQTTVFGYIMYAQWSPNVCMPWVAANLLVYIPHAVWRIVLVYADLYSSMVWSNLLIILSTLSGDRECL